MTKMHYQCFMFWIVFVGFLPFHICLDQASFYGGSYISVPLKEAKSSTDIHFKFRTHLPNTLLFLVAGATDYCIITLDNGMLKIIINLGAGENDLYCEGVKLNNFKWHNVYIIRKDGNFSVIINDIYKFQKHVSGDFFELNIHYGIFIGSLGNRTDLFFGHMNNFRGCLAEFSYNGMSVLEQARNRQSQSTVHGVTWNCAAEFEAPNDRAISFVEDSSFMAVTHPISDNMKLQLELKTVFTTRLVVYNTGWKMDHFALEIWEGKVKATWKHDDIVVEIVNDEYVSDGHWHKIMLKMNSNMTELRVDQKTKIEKFPQKLYFFLTDTFYIGGLEKSKQSRAVAKGLKQFGSLNGCLRHLSIGDKAKGLADVHISEGLLPGCVWQFACLSNPCINNSTCYQMGIDSFKCFCRNKICSNATKVFSKPSFATELELLALEPLKILEGQNILITTNNLHVILDYPKYGIKDSGIMFSVVEAPTHGSISVDVWPKKENVFTLADVAKDKVHYVHDGTESRADHIGLEVHFEAGELFILPNYLQGKYKFTLAINVAPVNDPPTLKISSTDVLRVAQGTKKVIGSDLLQVNDPDTSANTLVINILDAGPGHFEFNHKPSITISSFTRQDVENHDVAYVHHSQAANESYITLQVSDGIETSAPGKLRISAFPQFWRLHNNTGLILMHSTSSIITPYNLSFVSNVANAIDSAQYQIEQGPQFGVIEVEKDVGRWENTVIFSSDDLRQHRVRYRHITSRPDFDEFQFRTTLNLSMLYTFRMSFAKCRLFAINLNLLSLNERDEGALTVDQLRFQTDPVSSPTTSIVYHVVDPPKHGYLFYSVSKYHLRKQDVFTQEDVLMSNVKYKLYRKSYSLIVDSITVDIVAPGCRNVTETLHIRHVPSNETMAKVEAVLGHLAVEEGGVTSINNQTLNIRTDFATTDLLFNITSPPVHGVIQVNKGTSIRNNTNYFTKNELINNQVFYQHDDSESERDSFIFMVLSNKKEDFEYVNILNIVISLKNDNSLVRVIDKMFHVVVAGERLLTGEDLSYSDADIDTKMKNIVYTFRELPNGEFFDARNPNVKLSEFNQKDLNERSVLFKHKGPEFGKIKFSVTDGAYYVFGILEVQASAPFIRAVMSKRFAIQHGKCAVVTSDNLNFDTNLYASDDDVQYEVTTKPSFGKLIYTDSSKIVNKFTQTDVNNGLISYQNDVTTSSADEIGLKIRCRDAINVANFGTWMLPASYWEPLKVKTSRILYVEESTSAIIGKNTLEIVQPEVPPSAIIYHITELPENGYISILPTNQNGDDQSTNVRSFGQSLINENRIIYIQSVSNETMDKVTFNVTNGMVWLPDLTLHIHIIPERLYLGSHLLTVNEGGVAVISTLNLFIVTEYFKTRVSDYVILEEPKHGCIQIQRKCNKLHGFSHKEFAAGIVFYSHDGSENLEDSILLVGVAAEKRSIPVLLNITVLPVNDQKPKLVNNTGLIMWEGGTAVITKEMLGAYDADKPKDTLVYHLRSTWWGNITLASNRNIGLRNFTQDMIDKHQIVFRHKNGSEAKFVFNVSDGLHFTDDQTFYIKTKPVKLTFTHKPLHIFPSQPKYLTSVHLLSKVSDPEREIYYEIVTPPSLGHLMMKSDKGTSNVVNSFTQNDLNESRVIYKHVHPFSGLYANDSFVFNVKSHLAETLFNRKMKIEISVSSGGLDAYVTIPKIIVDEGGMTKIVLNFSGVVVFLEDHAGLRSPVIHASVVHPHHGQIFLQNQSSLSTFTQQQLESGQVHYQHDHSDSLGDNIYFSLYLIPGYIMLCNITVPVIINPINDQPFRLVTQAPHLTVVQGESRTISKVELCTEDLDTVPAELIYDTVSGPHEGKVVLLPDMITITQFTQADVDDNKLIYIHNSSVLTDTIHIRVWDGRFRPEYFVFNIKVLPIDLNVTGGLPVYIQQGMNVVHLRNQQFHVETNINRKRIQYVIRENPKHGLLYVKDRESNRFNQENLDENEVMYMQRDMTTANDSFRVFVGIFYGNTSSGGDVDINIKVQPLMQMGNCTVLAGEINKLSLHILDATPLAKLTSSNPKYTIVSPPKNGKIKKIIRSSGEHRNVLDTVVTTFTHEEVQSGLIYIAIKDMEVGWSGVADSIQFILAATIFQPAVAELKITIKSSLHNDIYSTLAGPNDPAGHEGGMHFASPNMTRDYFLIVSMVAGVIILGVAVIIVIKCRSFDPEEINKEEQCLQPIPLPRPPDRLMTSSPPLLKQSDGYVSPIPATLPHCKVTPLSRNELDTNARYPYGVDEHIDDWSSCDASDPACASRNNIMLRRNQYWV